MDKSRCVSFFRPYSDGRGVILDREILGPEADWPLMRARGARAQGETYTVTIGEHLAVAWKPGPESARALTAAAPLLSKAKKVSLIFVPEGDLSGAGASAALNKLADALRWHGIEPEPLGESPSGAGVAETIRTAAYNVGADLLVMGAYGHSRLREFILGGATRTIIAGCEMPVLLFH